MGSSPSRGGCLFRRDVVVLGLCGVLVVVWWLCRRAVGEFNFFLKINDLDGATGSFHVTDKYNPFYEKYSR